jgi:uncharacterized protein (DUF2132 family)
MTNEKWLKKANVIIYYFFVSGHLMNDKQPLNPLHGTTLEMMLTQLVADYGWTELGSIIDIRCFNHEPGIKSSLKFLRKTPWARTRVEELYISTR